MRVACRCICAESRREDTYDDTDETLGQRLRGRADGRALRAPPATRRWTPNWRATTSGARSPTRACCITSACSTTASGRRWTRRCARCWRRRSAANCGPPPPKRTSTPPSRTLLVAQIGAPGRSCTPGARATTRCWWTCASTPRRRCSRSPATALDTADTLLALAQRARVDADAGLHPHAARDALLGRPVGVRLCRGAARRLHRAGGGLRAQRPVAARLGGGLRHAAAAGSRLHRAVARLRADAAQRAGGGQRARQGRGVRWYRRWRW